MEHHQMSVFLTKLFRGAGGARARKLGSLLEQRKWGLLQEEPRPDPTKYRYASTLKRDRIVCEILRKCKFPKGYTDNDTRAEAVRTFWECEFQCGKTNAKLTRLLGNASESYFETPEDLVAWELILRWRKEVKAVLGRLPLRLTPQFSGGATVSHSGDQATIPDKLSTPGSIYPEAISIYEHSVKNTQLEPLCRPFDINTHNIFFTVPKDSVKDRGCCKEASLALQLQLAVGSVLKRKYTRRYKVDLRHAKPLHMDLARGASCGMYDLATIDLSNASDTVAWLLVKLLLPEEWFTLVNSLRATHTDIDGTIVRLNKFSSMGNGFTFELETIIFRALCTALNAKQAWVFGDDIIVSRDVSSSVISALTYFGFTPNVSKTFCEGPFRESCGGDYFEGQAVRPHFLEEFPNEPRQWVALANGLLRADPHQRWTRAAWRYCCDQVPTEWRNFVPISFGDVGLHHPDGDRNVPYKRDSNGTPWFRAMVPVGRKVALGAYSEEVHIVALLLGTGTSIPQRGNPKGYRQVKLAGWGVSDPSIALTHHFASIKPPHPGELTGPRPAQPPKLVA